MLLGHQAAALASPPRDVAASRADAGPFDVYVSPEGSDQNSGSLARPFMTLQRARNAVREMIARGMHADIIVHLRGGIYRLKTPLVLGPADSGQNGFRVVYESEPEERALLSAGRQVTGWSVYDRSKNIYRANVRAGWDFRQLYVNGVHATRARSAAGSFGLVRTAQGITTTDAGIANWKDISGAEVVFLGKWMMNRCRVAAVERGLISLVEPCWRNTLWAAKWGANTGSGNWLENAYELLRQPGEWYLDRKKAALYYIPRPGEDLATADVTAPVLDTLVRGRLVRNVTFRNLTFEDSNWTDPDAGNDGYVGLQAGFHKVGFRGELVPEHAAIRFSASHGITFEGNLFTHIGSRSLLFDDGCQHIAVTGNRFTETAGGAVQIGQINDGADTDPHIQNRGILIAGNRIDHVSFDYRDDMAIVALYVVRLVVTHNEIADIPHVAVSLGWGWGKGPSYTRENDIGWNAIHAFSSDFRDSAALYTLGPMPGTAIHDNYVRQGGRGYGCLYPDQGSAYEQWTRNVCADVAQWLHIWTDSVRDNQVVGNWSNSAGLVNRGTRNLLARNATINGESWPAAARQVMERAGVPSEQRANSE